MEEYLGFCTTVLTTDTFTRILKRPCLDWPGNLSWGQRLHSVFNAENMVKSWVEANNEPQKYLIIKSESVLNEIPPLLQKEEDCCHFVLASNTYWKTVLYNWMFIMKESINAQLLEQSLQNET